MNSFRWTWTYDVRGNLTSLWHYRWLISSWTPTDFPGRDGVTDSAGNSNPFNLNTIIKYELPRVSNVTLTVYDMLGRELSVLANDRREAGVHEVKFDGSGYSSGVYFYRLQAGNFVSTKRMLVLK